MSKLINLDEVRKKQDKKKIITNIIFFIVLIYIIYAIYLILKTPTETITVESGVLTAEESATGYIIREEKVVKGKNYKNGIYQIVAEGNKAAKNQTILRYYGQNEKEIQKKIDETNKKLQKALEKEKTPFPTDIKNLEEKLDNKIQGLSAKSDLQEIAEYKKQISEIMMKKATIAGENSKSGSYIKKIIKEKEKYEEKLIKGSEYIVAPMSGVVSYRVDGMEDTLKPAGFEELTEEKLENLDIKTGKIVASSNESAKVINNFECYIATVLDSIDAKQTEEGKKVQLTLSGKTEITGTVNYIKKQNNGKILVVFKINTLTEEIISCRKISFNITWWNISGIKVPNEAILEDEKGLKYVQKKTTTGNTKCLIKILKTNEQYSIIESYNMEDLKALGIDFSTYKGIQVYDTIMAVTKKE